ncbi:MAG: hypothetical protein ACLP0J_29545 [Solirubrobacteraceae bacterium]
MRRRLVVVGLLIVAAVSLGGYALARPGHLAKISHTEPDGAGWTGYAPLAAALHTSRSARSYPITSLPPGKLILATLRLRSGGLYFIHGQRICFQARLYFCLSAGNPNGSFQTCPPWPLAQNPTRLLIGGGPPPVELVVAIAPRDETCTFVDVPGGPYRASRVQMPTSLEIDGELVYAFLKPTPGEGLIGSANGEGIEFVIGSQGKARCAR